MTINRTHLAGLELARQMMEQNFNIGDERKILLIDAMIAQAQAAPEAEPVAWQWVYANGGTSPVYMGKGPDAEFVAAGLAAEFPRRVRYLYAAPQHDAELVELLGELAGAAGSVNRTRQHQIEIKGDDEPCYWQRKEWVDYIIELCAKADAKLSTLRHV